MRSRHLRLLQEYPGLYPAYVKLIGDPDIPLYLITSFNPKAARNAILKRELEALRLDIDFLDSLIPKENFIPTFDRFGENGQKQGKIMTETRIKPLKIG